jgi:carbon storage regulator
MIGEETEVTIVDIRGDKVRLGIKAPRSTSVHRKEVFDAIRRENEAAAQMQPGDVPTESPPPMRVVKEDPEPANQPEPKAATDGFSRAATEFMQRHGVYVLDLKDRRCVELLGKFVREHPEFWKNSEGDSTSR